MTTLFSSPVSQILLLSPLIRKLRSKSDAQNIQTFIALEGIKVLQLQVKFYSECTDTGKRSKKCKIKQSKQIRQIIYDEDFGTMTFWNICGRLL